MTQQQLDGIKFAHIVSMGAQRLSQQTKQVDALNVFPVPDGDTGTNMNLTLASGVKEMTRHKSQNISDVANALSHGLLLGARGNSGVILSQLFRGFAKEVQQYSTIGVFEFAMALQRGVDTAYQAVIKPVEGTILTVARDAAKKGLKVARQSADFRSLMEAVVNAARESLANTPELLPILKETGVVDAGGQGLVYIYEGMLAGFSGASIVSDHQETVISDSFSEQAHRQNAQAQLATENISFGFCTEFIIQLSSDQENYDRFDEHVFKDYLHEHGDSLLVVSDNQLVKVHIHTEEPLKMVEYGMRFGELRTVKIENMREQHRAIVEADKITQTETTASKYGLVAVAMGQGIVDAFASLGVHKVIEGGQTMNPSTEDIVNALKEIEAEHYIILPNNSNIVMAAEQAGKVLKRPTIVIPSKTIPEGLAAMFVFDPDATVQQNEEAMREAIARVSTGQVTYAVRDSVVNDLQINEGDFIGISNGEIRVSHSSLTHTVEQLLTGLVTDEHEILTIFYGEDVDESQAEDVRTFAEHQFPHLEVELLDGKQPLYYYLFSVE